MKRSARNLALTSCAAVMGAGLVATSVTTLAEIKIDPSYDDLNAATDTGLYGEGLAGEGLPRDMARIACDVLLDVARAGSDIVAIGQRGHVIKIPMDTALNNDVAFDHDAICDRSSAENRLWVQQSVPTRAFLNALDFPTPKLGWAVGHDATILHTKDGGSTWEMQFKAPDLQKPFLDVMFTDAQNGHAVGAFGMYYTTNDGGRTWTDQEALYFDPEWEEADDYHVNAMTVLGDGSLFAAGEAGVLYRKDAGSDTWEKLEGDYEGSYFGAIAYGLEGVIVYGLRGNVYASTDRGDSWEQMDTAGSTATFLGGTALPNGEVAIGGAKGTLFVSQGGGRTLVEVENPNDGAITGILPVGGSTLVMTSDLGVKTVTLQ